MFDESVRASGKDDNSVCCQGLSPQRCMDGLMHTFCVGRSEADPYSGRRRIDLPSCRDF